MLALVGNVAHYAAALYGHSVLHGLDDILSLLCRHFHESKTLHQVYLAHFHLHALRGTVYQTYDLLGIESVYLAHVEEQTCVAFLGLTRTAPAIALGALLATASLALLHLLNLRCIGIVCQEASELAADNALDKFLLVEPFPTAHHLGQYLGNLLFHHVHTLYVVDDTVELLLAYLLARRQGATLELLLYGLFYDTYLALFADVDYAYARTLLAGTACTSASVGIVLGIIGQTVVDDMRQVVHVQAACRHVRGHKQLCAVLAELLHGQVALLLGEVAMQGIGIVAVLYQFVGNLLCLHSGTTEYDAVDSGIVVHHTLQCQILVLSLHHVVYVVDMLRPLVARTHLYLLRVLEVLSCYGLNLLAHGGREEQCAVLLGYAAEDFVQVFLETHCEHFIGLVQYHVSHRGEVGGTALHQVYESARCGHEHVYATLEGTDLCLYAGTSVHGQNSHTLGMFGKALQIVGYLQAQLSGGCQNQGNGMLGHSLGKLHYGQTVCRRLAGTCLCQCHHVALPSAFVPVAQEYRYHRLLNGHGVFITLLANGLQYSLVQS